MKDSSQLGRRGEFLTLAQAVMLGLVVFPPIQIVGVLQGLGLAAILMGIIFGLYGLASLRKNFSPFPEPRATHSLVTDGAYVYVRHPIYCGFALLSLGLAAITHSETRLMTALLLALLLDFKARVEETALVKKYGKQYEQYMQSTRFRIIPALY